MPLPENLKTPPPPDAKEQTQEELMIIKEEELESWKQSEIAKLLIILFKVALKPYARDDP